MIPPVEEIKEESVKTETPSVTTTAKKKKYWIVGIVVVVLIIAFVGYKTVKNNRVQQMSYNAPSTTNTTIAPSVASPTMGSATASTTGAVTKADASNGQLDQDLQTIQGNLTQLGSEQSTSSQAVQSQSTDTQ